MSGGSITKAAKEAGVARETVSRWVHHDPAFLAELQNIRAEMAIQTRCALESLGMRAVGVLSDAVQNQFVKPWRLKAACAVLKMIGADRAETMASTTAEEVHVRLQEREAELQERQGKLRASEAINSRSIEVADDSETAFVVPVPTEAQDTEPGGNGKAMEHATETPQGRCTGGSVISRAQPVDDTLDDGGRVREEVINRFLESVADRVSRTDDVAVQPITIMPGPADPRSRQGESITQIIGASAKSSPHRSREAAAATNRHQIRFNLDNVTECHSLAQKKFDNRQTANRPAASAVPARQALWVAPWQRVVLIMRGGIRAQRTGSEGRIGVPARAFTPGE